MNRVRDSAGRFSAHLSCLWQAPCASPDRNNPLYSPNNKAGAFGGDIAAILPACCVLLPKNIYLHFNLPAINEQSSIFSSRMYHINSPQTSRQPLRHHLFNFYIDAKVSSMPLQSIRAARRLVSGSCKVAINHLNESIMQQTTDNTIQMGERRPGYAGG